MTFSNHRHFDFTKKIPFIKVISSKHFWRKKMRNDPQIKVNLYNYQGSNWKSHLPKGGHFVLKRHIFRRRKWRKIRLWAQDFTNFYDNLPVFINTEGSIAWYCKDMPKITEIVEKITLHVLFCEFLNWHIFWKW